MTHLLPLDPPTPRTPAAEIIVVGFAGGGGTCQGITVALGRDPDEALNHDPVAVAVHSANHPGTRHWCQNIWQANPADVSAGRPIGLAWFSPDCKHFSKAKGSAPKARNIRDLPWVVVAYAMLPLHLRPQVIMVENVEEMRGWGPLRADGQPCPDRKGQTFAQWTAHLTSYRTGDRAGQPVNTPIGTVTTVDRYGLVAAHLTHWYSSAADGGQGDLRQPIKTVTSGGQHAGLVTGFLTAYYGNDRDGQALTDPVRTVTATDRFGLVTVDIGGQPYALTDIGLRMLTPRELFRAQGFPDSYKIDIEINGKPISKAAQVRLAGNSVCPQVAAALVAANVPHLARLPVREAAE